MLDAFDHIGVQLYGKCIDVSMLTQYRVCVVWWPVKQQQEQKSTSTKFDAFDRVGLRLYANMTAACANNHSMQNWSPKC